MASTTFEIKERWHRLSDKTVCHTFYSIVDGERVECSVPECDFELVYFNPKQPQSRIVCGRIGGEWKNCGPVSGSSNKVLCYLSLSRYNIPEGELFCMVRLLTSDQNFLNSLKISQEPSFTGVYLWNGPSDNGSALTEQITILETLLYGYSNYQLAVRNGFKGTEQEYLASLHLAIQYSSDATSWHTTWTSSDCYMRLSSDNGKTWSGAIMFVADVSPMEGATAVALAQLNARLKALEQRLGERDTLIADRLIVRTSLENWGDSNDCLIGEGAPTVVPDKVGQRYIDITNKKSYTATGSNYVSDWK